MRARLIVVALALLTPHLAGAADLDGPRPAHRLRGAVVAGYGGYVVPPPAPPPGPVVVAPPATVLVVPPDGPRPGLHYEPPPVPNEPPPLIAAVPIIGPYLVPTPLGPPPATVLDTYDRRYDYNQ